MLCYMNFHLDAVVKLNILSKPNLRTSSVLDKAVVGTKKQNEYSFIVNTIRNDCQ